MKKINLLSIPLLSISLLTLSTQATANSFPTPSFGNNNGNFPKPNLNWGNNHNRFGNGSNFSMPNMNWGNNRNRFGSGSNFDMPNFNWGSNRNRFGSGSNFDMPSFNWGSNNNRFGNGSGFSMPSMNWGNNSNRYNPYGGPRWNPSYGRFGNAPLPPPPAPGVWRNNQNFNTYVQPGRPTAPTAPTIRPPAMPQPPVFNSNRGKGVKLPNAPTKSNMMRQAPKPMDNKHQSGKIPTPAEVKGVILAPQNKAKANKPEIDAKGYPNGVIDEIKNDMNTQ